MSGRESSGTIGWLRVFWDDPRDRAFAGILQSSGVGSALGFAFIRIEIVGAANVRGIVASTTRLIGLCEKTPICVFALAEELPAQFLESWEHSIPICLIGRSQLDRDYHPSGKQSTSTNGRSHLRWTGCSANNYRELRRVVSPILVRDEPFEPLTRAWQGLTEVVNDKRIQALAGIPGMETAISLTPRPAKVVKEKLEDRNTPAGHPDGTGECVGSGLTDRVWAAIRRYDGANVSEFESERLNWPNELMPFQHDGVRALIEKRRVLLSDDMGLGKTVQAIAAIRILKVQKKIDRALVVAPTGILDQWRRELDRWAPELSAIIVRGPANDRRWQWNAKKDVTLASYEVLRRDRIALGSAGKRSRTWDVVVLDEAQRIKNRNSTSDAAKAIGRRRAWALTGTPIENNESELASIIEFVDHVEGMPVKRYSRGEILRGRHRALQLRRKKGDVLEDLPPKLVSVVPIALAESQLESYRKAELEGIVYLKSLGKDVRITHILELITRLKQICNADPRTGASSKLDDIKERMRTLTAQGHKALIFSQYTSDVSGVAAAAQQLMEFNPLTLTGEIPIGHRAEIIRRFKTEKSHKALVVSLRAGGLGLNLQEASYVFHLDRWWNPALERQAEDRSHRLGQTVKVNVIKYSCKNTIEERIDRILRQKQELFDQLVDDVSMDLSTSLSRSELLGLFGLD